MGQRYSHQLRHRRRYAKDEGDREVLSYTIGGATCGHCRVALRKGKKSESLLSASSMHCQNSEPGVQIAKPKNAEFASRLIRKAGSMKPWEIRKRGSCTGI